MPDVALVTGGATRIGAAICRELAKDMHVVVHARTSVREAARLAEEIEGSHILGDLMDRSFVEKAIRKAGAIAGSPVTHLVNNASLFPRSTIHDATRADLHAMIDLHVWAPWQLARSMDGGQAVVNLLDTRIASADPDHAAYHLSKQALADLTRTLARELAPLRVNGVAPGPILEATDGGDFKAAVEATILKRQGTPDEVASAVRFMLTAPYTTGDVLYVDGGRHLK